jgi:hypothetical protein
VPPITTAAASAVEADGALDVRWPVFAAGWSSTLAPSGYSALFLRLLSVSPVSACIAGDLHQQYPLVNHETNVLLATLQWRTGGHSLPPAQCVRCNQQPSGDVLPWDWAASLTLPLPVQPDAEDWREKAEFLLPMRDAAKRAGSPALATMPVAGLHSGLQQQGLLPPGVPHISDSGMFFHPPETLPGTEPHSAPRAGEGGGTDPPARDPRLGVLGASPKQHLCVLTSALASASAMENLLYVLTFAVDVNSSSIDYVVVIMDAEKLNPGLCCTALCLV